MRAAAVLGLALVAATAWGMRVSRSEGVLAWSDDGKNALLFVIQDGPEGGSRHGLRLIGGEDGKREDVTISSDFSPGGPSRPQRVSVEACRKAATEWNTLLNQRRFSRVELDANACSKKGRPVVGTGDPTPGGAFEDGPSGQKIMGAARLVLQQDMLVLIAPASQVNLLPMTAKEFSNLRAYVSPTNHLLVLLSGERGSTQVLAVFYAAHGHLGNLKRVDGV